MYISTKYTIIQKVYAYRGEVSAAGMGGSRAWPGHSWGSVCHSGGTRGSGR